MRELDFKDIGNPESFQKFCEELLSAEYPDFRAIDDTRGDRGCDGLALNGELFFQVYYPEPAEFSLKVNKIKKKLRESLRKLRKPYPRRWILITTDNVPLDVHELARRKAKMLGRIKIDIWSEPKLRSLLHKHESIKKAWIQRIYGESYEIISPESVFYGKKDDLAALLEQDGKMGRSLKDWKHSKHFEQVHQFTSSGQAQVSLRAMHPRAFEECPVTVNGLFRFDDTPQGKEKYEEFLALERVGKSITLDDRFIDSIEFRVGTTTWSKFQRGQGPVNLVLSPIPRAPIPTRIDIFKRDKRVRRLNKIMLTPLGGLDKFVLSNGGIRDEEIRVSVTINPATNESDFRVGVLSDGADAVDAFEHASILRDFEACTRVHLELLSPECKLDFCKNPSVSVEIKNLVELARKLKDIQDRTGEMIPSIFERPLSDESIGTIEFVHKVVTEGRVRRSISITVKLGETTMEQAQRLVDGIGNEVKLEQQWITEDFLGVSLDLGLVVTYFRCRLPDESRAILKDAMQRGSIAGTEVTFIGEDDNVKAEHFFRSWLKGVDRELEEYEKTYFLVPPPLIDNSKSHSSSTSD